SAKNLLSYMHNTTDDIPVFLHIFFFQAEDGIRDRNVTGVQTCALPISATVDVAEPGMFEEVAEFTAPRVREVDLWWPEWLVREDLDNEGIVREEGPAPAPAPLEGIDAHVIDAADAGKLETWLEKNDYVIRDDVASALVPYAQQDWHFLLVKLEADALSGRMQPLDIRFETNQ